MEKHAQASSFVQAFTGLTSGGKEDDITVAVAWVVSEEDLQALETRQYSPHGRRPRRRHQGLEDDADDANEDAEMDREQEEEEEKKASKQKGN